MSCWRMVQFPKLFCQHLCQHLRWRGAIALTTSLMIVIWTIPARAAEDIVFTYGPLRQSVSVQDLEEFAKTGTVPRSLRFYLNIAKINPETIRSLLVNENQIDFIFLDNILNSLLGEYVLFQVGQIIHTRSRRANIQALRSALVLSAADGNSITLLEFFQNYPNQQVFVDGRAIVHIAGNSERYLSDQVGQIENWLVNIQLILAAEVCHCDENSE